MTARTKRTLLLGLILAVWLIATTLWLVMGQPVPQAVSPPARTNRVTQVGILMTASPFTLSVCPSPMPGAIYYYWYVGPGNGWWTNVIGPTNNTMTFGAPGSTTPIYITVGVSTNPNTGQAFAVATNNGCVPSNELACAALEVRSPLQRVVQMTCGPNTYLFTNPVLPDAFWFCDSNGNFRSCSNPANRFSGTVLTNLGRYYPARITNWWQ